MGKNQKGEIQIKTKKSMGNSQKRGKWEKHRKWRNFPGNDFSQNFQSEKHFCFEEPN